MSAWQPLPADLPPEVGHFVEQLRLLKDRTGLSLVALGARTAYSKSSWQRYLNATQPPPRQAVVALCRVVGEDAERFVVRWELAVRAWPRPADPAASVPAAGAAASVNGSVEGRGAERGTGGGTGGGAECDDDYEEAPTVPWWDLLADEPDPPRAPAPAPSHRLLLYAVLIVLALLLTALAGAVTLT
ncbi:helix-turn-helix domain-containing protein [Streptomyces sporangiiformans]|uniref:Helix-turn-helix domain-containing protein n=1 Tax=Streptomyces sporangiiformans TaxID=2315329 RepID=A0A505DDK7_9ACTN|nr:helix-turn-helix transcriptional regulator [Streptomyces sporangiiformans]TPQ21824.1 helix-turn-helix domain-containing protein [Streptomyces sporangiiformans]